MNETTATPEEIGLQEVKVVQDESSHNYVIPAELEARFTQLIELSHDIPYNKVLSKEFKDEYEVDKQFEKEFSEYRTSGDITPQLYAKVGYQNESEF